MWGSGGYAANSPLVIYQFGDFQLEPARFELRQGGTVVSLEPQVFEVLCFLIEQRHRVVSREELLDRVWQSRFVNDSTLSHRVMEARRIIGDDGKAQSKIRTVRGRGFRFVGKVVEHSRETTSEASHHRPTSSPKEPVQRTESKKKTLVVGRDAELQTLEKHLAQVASGARKLIFVTGEAGQGKTTLVERFLQESRVPFARGQCLEHFGSSEPYLPVLDALGQLCSGPNGPETLDVLRQFGPTWLGQLPAHQTEEDLKKLERCLVGTSRERMLREMGETLEALTRDHPFILFLEDLHWSDPSTLDLLAWTARRKLPAKLMLVGTLRPFEAAVKNQPASSILKTLTVRGQASELPLSGLSQEAIGDLLLQRGFQDSEQAQNLLLKTAGNPLYIRCLLNSWEEQQALEYQASQAMPTSLPESLRELIEQQMGHLSPEERTTLEGACLLNGDFSARAVSSATGLGYEETEGLCTSLVRRGGFLAKVGPEQRADRRAWTKFTFTHALVREAIEANVSLGRRALMHARIAEHLESTVELRPGERAAEIAQHYEKAGRPAEALPHLIAAAKRALRHNASEEANHLITRAFELLTLVPSDSALSEWEIDLHLLRSSAEIARSGWSTSTVEMSYLKAYELSSQRQVSARSKVALGLATVYEMRGDYHRCQALLEAHFTELSEKVEAHELLACSLYHQGDFGSAREHAERGIQLYDSHNHLDLPMASFGDNPLVSCRAWVALSSAHLGEMELAESLIQGTLEMVESDELSFTYPLALIQAATLYQLLERPSLTFKHAEKALEAAHRFGFAHHRAAAEILAGWAAVHLRELDDGMSRITTGLNAYRATGARIDLPYFLMLQSQVALRLGERPLARKALWEALQFTSDGRRLNVEAEIFRLMGDLEPCHRESWYQRALQAARKQGSTFLENRILGRQKESCAET